MRISSGTVMIVRLEGLRNATTHLKRSAWRSYGADG